MFWAWLGNLLTGGVLGRAFDTIDKKIASDTDKEKLKADVAITWLQNRMVLPWWLDACFILPLGLYWAFVLYYSAFLCMDCMNPQDWTIAALPSPLDDWAGWIVMSRFGAGVVQGFVKR